MKTHSLFCITLSVSALLAFVAMTATLHAAPALPAAHLAPSDFAGDFACADVEEIPAAECQALVAFAPRAMESRESLDWFTTNTPCSWFGVSCTNGHVTGLDLSGKNIEATLPPALGDLTELMVLKIVGAEVGMVSGPIPPEVGTLSELRELVISSNFLSGPIPPELGALSNLETLNLLGNELSGGIPAELGQLQNLQSLILGVEVCGGGRCANQLSGPLPPALGNLANLRELLIAGNAELSGAIPQSFVYLEALEEFHFGGTELCVPADDSLQTWLESVPEHSDTDTLCGASPTYSITGRIVDGDGSPVAGVTLSIHGSNPARSETRATTGASGLYEFTNLDPDTYTLLAEDVRYTFTPPTVELTVPPAQLQQNFLAEHEAAGWIYLPIVSQMSGARR